MLTKRKLTHYPDAVLVDLLGVLNSQNSSQATALKERSNREMTRYANEQQQIKVAEQNLETESKHARRQANRLDVAELFCELALVLCSITLLTRQRPYWFGGMMAGGLGLVILLSAFLVR